MSGAAPQVSQLLLLLLPPRTAADANACMCYAFTLAVRALMQPSRSAKVTRLTVHPIHESRLSLLGVGQLPPSTSTTTTPTRQQVDNEGRVHQPERRRSEDAHTERRGKSGGLLRRTHEPSYCYYCLSFLGRGGEAM